MPNTQPGGGGGAAAALLFSRQSVRTLNVRHASERLGARVYGTYILLAIYSNKSRDHAFSLPLAMEIVQKKYCLFFSGGFNNNYIQLECPKNRMNSVLFFFHTNVFF